MRSSSLRRAVSNERKVPWRLLQYKALHPSNLECQNVKLVLKTFDEKNDHIWQQHRHRHVRYMENFLVLFCVFGKYSTSSQQVKGVVSVTAIWMRYLVSMTAVTYFCVKCTSGWCSGKHCSRKMGRVGCQTRHYGMCSQAHSFHLHSDKKLSVLWVACIIRIDR